MLDVACGGGWVSHWLTKIGYDTLGIDISEEFVRLAHRRIELDTLLYRGPGAPTADFAVHNLELDETPEAWKGGFDAAILESCLHHFVDPISALAHIREMLKPDGVVLILEGENRRGPISAAYVDIMVDTRTLERPYPRELLLEVLEHAGFPHCEFMGAINGFFPASSPEAEHIAGRLAEVTRLQNNCVVATSAEALRRVIPSYGQAPPAPANPPAEPAPAPAPAPAAPPSLAARIKNRLKRLF